MAEDIRVTEVGGSQATLPSNPGGARDDIQRTRERMSGTIDEIEGALLRKKEEIRERFDLMGRVRERPLEALGIALGAGLLLGLATGGSDEDEEDREASRRGWSYDEGDRAEMWERRARRLLSIAREQEDEIDRLQGRSGGRYDRYAEDLKERAEEVKERASMMGRTAERAVEHASGVLADYVEQAFRRLVSG
ncbi:MAG TPA: hypothetical protein VFI96_06965 [Longimicrobiaceae bacterium]|nr:hypothetical protein [Longimicrobiaceae bacterium]